MTGQLQLSTVVRVAALLAVFLVVVAAGADVARALIGEVSSHQKISDTVGGFTGTLDNSDHFAYAVGALGDHDGDGVCDVVVGAWLDELYGHTG